MIDQASSVLRAVLPYITVPDGRIGPIPIHPFGLLVATGVIIGHRMATKRAKDLGLDERVFESLVFWTVATGFVLSHMLDAIFYHPEVVRENPLELFMIHHGLSSFGGFFGAAIGFTIYSIRHRVDAWRSADAICYGLPVGWLFGRMGCSIVHDHPGRLSNHALAVNYPPAGVANEQLPAHFIFRVNSASAAGIPRFDLGLAELALTPLLVIAAIVIARRSRKPGVVVATLALVYPVLRFPLDFLRATEREGGDVRYLGLTPGQYACVLMFLLGAWIWYRTHHLPPDSPTVLAERKKAKGAKGAKGAASDEADADAGEAREDGEAGEGAKAGGGARKGKKAKGAKGAGAAAKADSEPSAAKGDQGAAPSEG